MSRSRKGDPRNALVISTKKPSVRVSVSSRPPPCHRTPACCVFDYLFTSVPSILIAAYTWYHIILLYVVDGTNLLCETKDPCLTSFSHIFASARAKLQNYRYSYNPDILLIVVQSFTDGVTPVGPIKIYLQLWRYVYIHTSVDTDCLQYTLSAYKYVPQGRD